MLKPSINIYGGKCAEAMELYRKAFGATVNHVAYSREAPDFVASDRDDGSSVMYADVTILGSEVEMFDSGRESPERGNTLALHAFFDTGDDVCRAFEILKEGTQTDQGPRPEFWSAMYTCLTDRYGIVWHLMVK